MPRIESIIDRYSPLVDYEWEVHYEGKCVVATPVFRKSGDYGDAGKVEVWPCNMDYHTARFLNNVEVLEFERFLARLPPLVEKIVVLRDGEPVRTFYRVKNIFPMTG